MKNAKASDLQYLVGKTAHAFHNDGTQFHGKIHKIVDDTVFGVVVHVELPTGDIYQHKLSQIKIKYPWNS